MGDNHNEFEYEYERDAANDTYTLTVRERWRFFVDEAEWQLEVYVHQYADDGGPLVEMVDDLSHEHAPGEVLDALAEDLGTSITAHNDRVRTLQARKNKLKKQHLLALDARDEDDEDNDD